MRLLVFAVVLVGLLGPPLIAADETPAPAAAPGVAGAAPCQAPCPTGPPGPPPPLVLPLPGTYPQYNLPAVYLRQRSIHDGPAGYRSAPWHPIQTPAATPPPVAPPVRGPTGSWWPW